MTLRCCSWWISLGRDNEIRSSLCFIIYPRLLLIISTSSECFRNIQKEGEERKTQ